MDRRICGVLAKLTGPETILLHATHDSLTTTYQTRLYVQTIGSMLEDDVQPCTVVCFIAHNEQEYQTQCAFPHYSLALPAFDDTRP